MIDRCAANATSMGSRKMDTIKTHAHGHRYSDGVNGIGNGAQNLLGNNNVTSGFTSQTFGTAETAPRHVAFYPRIHV